MALGVISVLGAEVYFGNRFETCTATGWKSLVVADPKPVPSHVPVRSLRAVRMLVRAAMSLGAIP